jgi:hypothetical protein
MIPLAQPSYRLCLTIEAKGLINGPKIVCYLRQQDPVQLMSAMSFFARVTVIALVDDTHATSSAPPSWPVLASSGIGLWNRLSAARV